MKTFAAATAAALALVVAGTWPAAAADIETFGRTCVKSNNSIVKEFCLSSNGTTVSSKYVYRSKWKTTGRHTGCKSDGSTISCSGGSYTTTTGDKGRMDPFKVRLKGGKPVSAGW